MLTVLVFLIPAVTIGGAGPTGASTPQSSYTFSVHEPSATAVASIGGVPPAADVVYRVFNDATSTARIKVEASYLGSNQSCIEVDPGDAVDISYRRCWNIRIELVDDPSVARQQASGRIVGKP